MAVANGAFTRTNSFGPESRGSRLAGLLPRFEMKQVQDPLATEREGRPIFREVETVELITPGNPLNIPVETVTDEHRQHWPDVYRAFKQGHEISTDGTPLEQWPMLTRSQVMELKAINLMTVEHVRDMNDHVLQRIMAGRRLKAMAKAYLDEAEAGAALAQATADNERKSAEIAELRHKVEELTALLGSVHSEMQAMKNAPHPLATVIPGMGDPIEQAKQVQGVAGQSSLDDLPNVRQRGRKSA